MVITNSNNLHCCTIATPYCCIIASMGYLVDSGTSPNLETTVYRATLFEKRPQISGRFGREPFYQKSAVCAAKDLFIGNLEEIFFQMSGYTKIFNS